MYVAHMSGDRAGECLAGFFFLHCGAASVIVGIQTPRLAAAASAERADMEALSGVRQVRLTQGYVMLCIQSLRVSTLGELETPHAASHVCCGLGIPNGAGWATLYGKADVRKV